MQVQVTNGGIFNSREALGILSRMRLPVLVSFQVAKVASKLKDPQGIIDSVRNGLIREYGQQQESGELLVILPNDPANRPVSPDWEKFNKEYDELMAKEVELDIEKIKLPQEVDGKPLQIEAFILIALEKFIEVE